MGGIFGNSNRWICGNFSRELFWFYIPCILTILVPMINTSENSAVLFYHYIITMAVVDTGHVATTVVRTYLNPIEIRRSSMYWIIPVTVSVIFFLISLQAQSAFLYAIVYTGFRFLHGIQQNYGLSRWYQKMNHSRHRFPDYVLAATSLIGGIAFFYSNVTKYGFSNEMISSSLSKDTIKIFRLLYILLVTSFIIYEVKAWKIRPEFNRIVFLSFAIAISGLSLFSNATTFFIAALVFHGTTYMGAVSTAALNTNFKNMSYGLVTGLVLLLAGIYATFSWNFNSILTYMGLNDIVALTKLSLGIFVTHVIIDSVIWRGSHPEAKAIFQ